MRGGEWVGITGKPLTSVVSVGIGGSALGPLFVHTALSTDPEAMAQVGGLRVNTQQGCRRLQPAPPRCRLQLILGQSTAPPSHTACRPRLILCPARSSPCLPVWLGFPLPLRRPLAASCPSWQTSTLWMR